MHFGRCRQVTLVAVESNMFEGGVDPKTKEVRIGITYHDLCK